MAIGRGRYADLTFWSPAGDTAVYRVPNATVSVYEAGTTTPVTDTLYKANTGATAWPGNPFTVGSDGAIELYLDRPRRLKLVVTSSDPLIGTLTADNVEATEDPGAVTELIRPARYYGIKGDFATNDSPHIQDAIDDAANAAVVGGHGLARVTLDAVGIGKCLLNDTLIMRKGVHLQGPGILNDNANLDDAASFPLQLYWNGAANGVMVYMRSDTGGNVLTGASLTGLYLDGRDTAGIGILMSSTQYCRVDDVYLATMRNYGLRLDDGLGRISKHNIIGTVKWFAGTPSWIVPGQHCDNAIGVILEGGLLWGVTLNQIMNVSGSRINGSTIYLGWADNNTFLKMHSTHVDPAATGKGLVLNQNTGTDPDPASPTYGLVATKAAGGNTFVNVMDKVSQVNNGSGNTIVSYTSEGGGIDDPGNKLRILSAEDYVTGDSYRSHQYKTTGRLSFSPGDLASPDGTATRAGFAGLYDTWRLQNGATQSVAGVKEPDDEWGPGTITEVRVYCSMDTTNTGTKNVALQLKVGSQAPAAPGAPPALAYTYDSGSVAKQVDNAIGTLFYVDFTGITVAHARNGEVGVMLTRVGGSGSDDASGDLYIRQIRVRFVGSGPDSAGSGTYTFG